MRGARSLLIWAILLSLISALIRFGPGTDTGRALIADLVSGQRVGQLGWLEVSGLKGDPWEGMTIGKAAIRDRRGVWVAASNVRASWRLGELLERRLRITDIQAQSVTVERAPIPLAPRPSSPSPVAVRIDHLATQVTLMPAFAGRRGDYLLDGALDVERDNTLSGRAHGVSLAHPGDFVRLGFVVGHRRVDVEAHASEALGGALAGSLGLDAGQPFGLDARVHGTPRAGAFDLLARIGALTPARASGRWSPLGGSAEGSLDLAASRWLAPWRTRIGPDLAFQLSAARRPSRSGSALYGLTIAARTANLDLAAAGDVDPARRRTGDSGVDLNLAVKDLAALTGVPGLASGKASGRLTGEPSAWTLSGSTDLTGASAAGFSLVGLAGPYTLETADGGARLRLQLAGRGGAGTGPLAVLLGAAPKASADAQWLGGGRILLRHVTLDGAALQVDGQGERGLFGDLTFKGHARTPDLAAAAAGVHGAVEADWRASQGRGDAAPWVFSVHAVGRGLKLGEAQIDSLLGATPSVDLNGRVDATGARLQTASLDGAAGRLTAAGTVAFAGPLDVALGWDGTGPLVLGPLTITGRTKGQGRLAGRLDRPGLDMTADLGTLDLPDAPDLRLRQARLSLGLLKDGDIVSGHASLTAVADQGPARALGAFRWAGGELGFSDLDIDAGGAKLGGAATLRGAEPVAADLTATLDPGAFLAQGHLAGRLTIAEGVGGARARLSLKGAGLRWAGSSNLIDTVSMTGDGPLARLPFTIDARGLAGGMKARLAGSGAFAREAGAGQIAFNGAGRFGSADFKTVAPANLTLRAASLTGDLHLAVGGGRADVAITDGAGKLDASATVAGINLSLLDPDIRGRADGTLKLAGAGERLEGDVDARVSGLTGRDLEGAPPLAGVFKASLRGGVLALSNELSDSKGSRMSGDLRLPVAFTASPLHFTVNPQGPMTGAFSADGEIGPIWNLVEGGGRTLSGHMVAHGTVGGTLADPRLTGTAAIAGGAFQDPGAGLALKGVTLSADLKGNAIDVASFNATDGAKGAISGSGRLSLERSGASALRLNLKDFRLIDTALVQAAASGAVDVDRAADGRVRLAGTLTVDHALISPTAPVPSGVAPMDVVEINGPADLADAASEPAQREPPVELNINLRAPGGIFIKGRGLNLELSLDAKVAGSSVAPALSGTAKVVRGDFDFAGQRFQIDDTGQVILGSTAETIRLSLTARRDDPNLTALVMIGGTAAAPTLTLSSTPVLPTDEILSQVLFGSSAAQLSGLQAAQLASALAGLAKGGGLDVIGGLRNFAHLDRLAIDSAAATGFSVAGGKYVTDKVYVELQGGGKIGQGVQVEWRVRKHLAIVSRVTSEGDHAVSIRWRKDY